MKAITIWQPWASLLAIGAKRYETRNWETKYRGPIAIHAAKKDPCNIPLLGLEAFEEAAKEELEKAGLSWCLLPTGKIIATAELVECWKITDNGHTNGSPLAARIEEGAQRLWNWDVETRQATEMAMPCPFCGQTPERTVRVGDGGIGYYATVACFIKGWDKE